MALDLAAHTPDTVDEAASILVDVWQAGQRTYIGDSPDSGNREGGSPIVVSLQKLDRIVRLDVGDGVIVAQAGVRVGAVREACTAVGLWCPPLRWLPASTSIGAVIAGGVGRRSRTYGSVADHLLGLRFACPAVGLVRHGGAAIKNATGYNLSAIVAGSRGELGVILEATLRLVPIPPCRQVRFMSFDSIEPLRAAWNELTLTPIADAVEVSAGVESLGGKAILEVEGIVERTVTERVDRLMDLGGKLGGTVTPVNQSIGSWNAGQTVYRSSFTRPETDAFLEGLAQHTQSDRCHTMAIIEGTGGGIEIVSDVKETQTLQALARHLVLPRPTRDRSIVNRHLKAAFDPRNQLVSQPLLLHSYVESP